MKTAEEKFYQDHPRSPRQMDWDKYEKEAPFFDSGCVIEFAESYAIEQNAELRKEMDDLIAANEFNGWTAVSGRNMKNQFTLPSTHKIEDTVYFVSPIGEWNIKAIVKAVTFTGKKVLYDLDLIFDDGRHTTRICSVDSACVQMFAKDRALRFTGSELRKENENALDFKWEQNVRLTKEVEGVYPSNDESRDKITALIKKEWSKNWADEVHNAAKSASSLSPNPDSYIDGFLAGVVWRETSAKAELTRLRELLGRDKRLPLW